jgi:predicted RNA-binding Zn-ribbon protein involved in translation (DUF1610 family)
MSDPPREESHGCSRVEEVKDPIVTYECPLAGETHAVPSPDVRVLRVGDGGFVVACSCSDEPLEEADSKPHPTVDHFVNIYAEDPSPEEWVRLERIADGWHDTTAWNTPEDGDRTWGQRRAEFRDKVQSIVDEPNGRDVETKKDRLARKVECPNCGASPGTKCQRPSGHSVRISHSDRKELAKSEGVFPGDSSQNAGAASQSHIEDYAA